MYGLLHKSTSRKRRTCIGVPRQIVHEPHALHVTRGSAGTHHAFASFGLRRTHAHGNSNHVSGSTLAVRLLCEIPTMRTDSHSLRATWERRGDIIAIVAIVTTIRSRNVTAHCLPNVPAAMLMFIHVFISSCKIQSPIFARTLPHASKNRPEGRVLAPFPKKAGGCRKLRRKGRFWERFLKRQVAPKNGPKKAGFGNPFLKRQVVPKSHAEKGRFCSRLPNMVSVRAVLKPALCRSEGRSFCRRPPRTHTSPAQNFVSFVSVAVGSIALSLFVTNTLSPLLQ